MNLYLAVILNKYLQIPNLLCVASAVVQERNGRCYEGDSYGAFKTSYKWEVRKNNEKSGSQESPDIKPDITNME
jgi:hypothetical protein